MKRIINGKKEEIRPLSPEEAQKWAEENLDVEEFERIFEVIE